MHILSGVHKGRKLLPPPKGAETRPITGLAKKSLFGTLGPLLPGAMVADLYCGTGTLGLEALSNGAGRCIFAERDRAVISRLKRNIDELGVTDQCILWPGDLRRRLAARLDQFDTPVDIAFVDPPYARSRQWDWPTAQRELFAPLAAHLSADGLIVLRLDTHVELPDAIASLSVDRRRTYGSMALVYLRADPAGASS